MMRDRILHVVSDHITFVSWSAQNAQQDEDAETREVAVALGAEVLCLIVPAKRMLVLADH